MFIFINKIRQADSEDRLGLLSLNKVKFQSVGSPYSALIPLSVKVVSLISFIGINTKVRQIPSLFPR